MLIQVYGSAVIGIHAMTIAIEVFTGGLTPMGKNGFYLVGLPDNAIRESYQRVQAALSHSKLKLPRNKMVINMAPADIRKEGSAYDLPIAVGMAISTKLIQTSRSMRKIMMMGELSLDGTLRPIKGALSMAKNARDSGFEECIFPIENAQEASWVEGIKIYGAGNLTEVLNFLKGTGKLNEIKRQVYVAQQKLDDSLPDFSDVKGQLNIKRALEIAAAGGHNVILIGPPGSGKTMLAKRLPSILPQMEIDEALETTQIHSIAGALPTTTSLIKKRPFRSPHHTVSDVALVGGGSFPMPGEISLAHHGILFLDELPEFKRSVLEVLRQPLESRSVTISRARMAVDFPSNFMLVASMNPCPCGFYNHPVKECQCGSHMVDKYLNKISGPLLDRIDLHVEVTPVAYEELAEWGSNEERSDAIRKRVVRARAIQKERFLGKHKVRTNAEMNSVYVRKYCKCESGALILLKKAMEKLQLSARAYDRILKVARTVADLENSEIIKTQHISEAINYRSLDKAGWSG